MILVAARPLRSSDGMELHRPAWWRLIHGLLTPGPRGLGLTSAGLPLLNRRHTSIPVSPLPLPATVLPGLLTAALHVPTAQDSGLTFRGFRKTKAVAFASV